jgi:hypothetical protein
VSGHAAGSIIFQHDAVGAGSSKCTVSLYVDGELQDTREYKRGYDEATYDDISLSFGFDMPAHSVYIELNIKWN